MKKFFLLIVIFLSCSQVLSADFNYCKTFYTDGNFTKAASCFQNRTATNPKDIQSHLWYAASLYYDKQYQKAYEYYTYIAQKFPNTSAAEYSRSEAQKVQQRIRAVNSARNNDTGNYISELDYATKWTDMPIRVWLAPSRYTTPTQRAFSVWQNKSGNLVRFIYVSNKNTANIKVYFVDKITNAPTGEELGITNLVFTGNKNTSAEIQLLQRTKSNQFCSDSQVYYAALHEIGHALGLSGHSRSFNDIMYYNSDTNSKGLSNRDINTLKAVYSR